MNDSDTILELASNRYSPLMYGVVSNVLVFVLIKNSNSAIYISYKCIANTATRQCRYEKLTPGESDHCPRGMDAYWTRRMFKFPLECDWLTQR